MVRNLKDKGWDIELVANPSVTGWTTEDLIEKELPVFDRSNATLVSLLIGVNDWVQEVPAEKYSKNLDIIIDHVRKGLPDPSKLVIINIPDFGVTPEGPKYSKGRDISKGIDDFNSILKLKANSLGLAYVDINPITKGMKGRAELIAKDGLHPSAQEYALWEPLIRESIQGVFQ